MLAAVMVSGLSGWSEEFVVIGSEFGDAVVIDLGDAGCIAA